jgi:hypothetical protein
MVLARNAHG